MSVLPRVTATGPDRIDDMLIADHILTTILPREELAIGYATQEKINYYIAERFRESAKSHISELLQTLAQEGQIIESPFKHCWRRKPT